MKGKRNQRSRGSARRSQHASQEPKTHPAERKETPDQNGGAANPATQVQPIQEETNTRAAKEWPKRPRRKDPSGNAQASTNRLKRGRPCRREAGGGRGTAGNPANSKAGPCDHAAQRRNQNQQPQRSARRKHPTRTASVEGKGRTRGEAPWGRGNGDRTVDSPAQPAKQARPTQAARTHNHTR